MTIVKPFGGTRNLSAAIKLSEHIAQIRKQLAEKRQHSLVIDIFPTSVSKLYHRRDELEDASLAIELAQKLGVRTPRVQRIVEGQDGSECILDKVSGPTLMSSWASLGWVATLRLGLQLRGMVRRMRNQTSSVAGSLGTGIARTFWMEDTYGIPLRTSARVITSLVNFWYNLRNFRQESRKSKEEHLATCEGPISEQPLVFTHHDLAPRNLMIDEAGDLVIIDWDYAGYYPPYFEHAGMYNFFPPEDWGWITMLRWKVFSWLATGFYSREKSILFEGRRKAIRFRAGRRFNVLAGATPSTRAVDD
ncbi:hypothetical protein F4808DRAFT_449695 [Astrocystis sublimbata]|nr:hypothetical protein F4808DRAFT_449695 [Astrocystis sublimbata]